MKGFFPTLLIVCALLGGAAWYLYDPHLKPYFEKRSGSVSLSDGDRVIAEPVAPVAPKPRPATPTTSAPKEKAPAAPAPVAAPAPKSELELALESRYPMPEILPLLTIVDQWRNVPPNAFPAEIVAKQTIPFQLVVDGQVLGSSNVAPGTPLKPLRLEGDQVVIASPANPAMNTRIAVDQTDFKERIEARYRQFVEAKTKEVEAKRERARQILAADPARLAQFTGKKETAPAAPDDSGDPRFAPVKASLRNGEAASVTLEEAKSFHWNGTETIKGESFAGTYETVTVNFEVETIFGKFPVEYKALLQGGKVTAWIDPLTEERI